MKIRVVIPCWKRPAISRFCFRELQKLKTRHQVDVLCVISESDYIDICKEFGFDWYMTANNPVGAKINTGLKRALVYDCDYVMVMNSDSVIRSQLLDVYEPFFESLNPYFGINKITYVDTLTGQAREFSYDFSVLGVGKCLHRSAIEKVFSTVGEVYRNDLNRGLDDTMMDNMIKAGFWPTIVPYDGMLAMDFKSDININGWEKFKDKGKKVCYEVPQELANLTVL